MKILLVSGASLVGHNIREALAGRRAGVTLIATNSVPDAAGLDEFDTVYSCPATAQDPEAMEQRLLEILAEEAPEAIIPCRDADVEFLARFASRHPEQSARIMTGSPEVAAVLCDKWLSFRFSLENELPFADSALATRPADVSRLLDLHGWPLLVKPRAGFASRNVALLYSEAQVQTYLGQHDMLFQEYLGAADAASGFLAHAQCFGLPLFHSFEDTKYSLQTMISQAGKVIGTFASAHIMRAGKSLDVSRLDDPALIELAGDCAEKFARAGWRGPLNIQCQRTPDGGYRIYEFNGRFTGATAARLKLGHDEVALGLSAFTGKQIPASASPSADKASKQSSTVVIDQGLVADLLNCGKWHRPAAGKAE